MKAVPVEVSVAGAALGEIPAVKASQTTAAGPILVVPCVEAGRGGGHLARCAALVRDLGTLGRDARLYLASTGTAAFKTLAPLLKGLAAAGPGDIRDTAWAFIVLDRFQTPGREYRFWSSLAPLIGIDEGGPCRDRFDFLIDLLPGPPGRSLPNFLDPGLLPLPVRRRPPSAARTDQTLPPRVLISFGAEDSAGLGPRCAAALAALKPTLISPRAPSLEGVTVLPALPALGEHLAEYDLLLTHFGLTAFEALGAGVPVLLLSPSSYHRRLAGAAGFISAGSGGRGVRRLRRLLIGTVKPGKAPARRGPAGSGSFSGETAFLDTLGEHCRSLARRYGLDQKAGPSLASYLVALQPEFQSRRCPLCGDGPYGGGPSQDHPVLARFPNRIFRRCPRCGLWYMSRTDRPPVEYAGEYFFESYRKQYGKTYLEDFPNLMAMGEKRLSRIVPLVPAVPGKAKLLDIGCAYGPFLKAASHAGFEVLGLDPAEEAAAYVRDTLKLPAVRGLFPPPKDGAPGEDAGMYAPGTYSVGMYSVITLWYVIEHMRNPGEALAEARRLLMDGGVLAFSTPSFAGISGKKSPAAFLEKSPQDHWTIWAPRICGRILRRQGFALKKIVVSGHHPERFPLAGKLCAAKRGPVYQFLLLLSRIFGLGDTFEVYAVKIPQKPGKERT